MLRNPIALRVKRGEALRRARPVVLLCGIAGASGFAAAYAPWPVALGATAAAAVILVAGVTVSLLPVTPPAAVTGRGLNTAASPHLPGDFRLTRSFYYAGLFFVGELTFRLGGGFTLSDWLFLVALISTGCLLAIGRTDIALGVPSAFVVAMAIFAAGALTASIEALSPGTSVATLGRVLYVTVVWFLLGTILLKRVNHLQVALSMWLLSAAIAGGGAIVQLILGPGAIPGTESLQGRMTGFTQHPNDLGAVTAIAFVPALYLATRRTRVALFALPSLGLIAAGLALSGSVTGLIAAAAATCVWLVWARLSRRLVLVGVALIIGVGAAVSANSDLGGETPLSRIDAVSSSGQADTLQARISLDQKAWAVVQDAPLVGVGFGAPNTSRILEEPRGTAVHNLFLASWLQAGILGMIGIALALITLAVVAKDAVAYAASTEEQLLAKALGAAYAAFVVVTLGAPILFQRYAWVPAALLLVLRFQQRSGCSQEWSDGREVQRGLRSYTGAARPRP